MMLSERLEKIVEMVPKCARVADIGCDHAYVAIELVRRGKAGSALACDVREGPCLSARANVAEAGLSGQIEVRLGDGLSEVEAGEVDTVVIAGMGGELMTRILAGRLHEFSRFVLSPQSELDRVRHFLLESGMRIADEQMVLDGGKFYTVMLVEAGEERYDTECAYMYGQRLLEKKDEVLLMYLKKEYARYAAILKQTQDESVLRACDLCIQAMKLYRDEVVTVKDIMERLEAWAPRAAACDWDNAGLLIGRRDKEVGRVFVALDATVETVDRAIEEGADLIVTHHPMIFKALKQINDGDALGRKIIDLIRNDVSLFAMHTNFDACPGGMADLVCERLGFRKTGVLEKVPMEDEGFGIGFTAELKAPMDCAKLAALVKERFGLSDVRMSDVGLKVRTLAVCPGSGRGFVRDIIRMKPDVFITGDMGHHEALDLKDEGISLIEAGHYGLEHIFVDEVADELADRFDIEVLRAEQGEPFQTV